MRQYERPKSFLRGGELGRLGAMLGMLCVLAMLIFRARDASTWHWLTGEGASEVAQAAPEDTEAARLRALGAENKDDPPADQPAGPAAPQDASEPPPHEDPEEIDALKEDLEVVVDRSLAMAKVEMPAYWRLMSWAKSQPVEVLKKKAQSGLVFNDFIQSPKNHRGQLVRLDLNIRRVLSYPAEEGNPAGVSRVYEIWGWSNESQAWLYTAVTSELPAGMPQGPTIDEKATLYGYFFKLQGYHEAGAKPNARALPAPLFVGKLAWQPARAPATQEPTWAWWLFGGAVLVVAGTIAGWILRPRPRPRRALSPASELDETNSLEEWLSQPSDRRSLDLTGPQEYDDSTNSIDVTRNGNGKHD